MVSYPDIKPRSQLPCRLTVSRLTLAIARTLHLSMSQQRIPRSPPPAPSDVLASDLLTSHVDGIIDEDRESPEQTVSTSASLLN